MFIIDEDDIELELSEESELDRIADMLPWELRKLGVEKRREIAKETIERIKNHNSKK